MKVAKQPKALQAAWDQWYLLHSDDGCRHKCCKSSQDVESDCAALRLGPGIRNEETGDQRGRQLQGHNLAQKNLAVDLANSALVTLAAALPFPSYIDLCKTLPFIESLR